MNRWLQTRLFTCSKCRANYLHDHAYRHELFNCLNRIDRPTSENAFLNRLSYVQFVSGAPNFQQLAGPHSGTIRNCAKFVLSRDWVFHALAPSNRDQNRDSQNGTVTKTVMSWNIQEEDYAVTRLWVRMDKTEITYFSRTIKILCEEPN